MRKESFLISSIHKSTFPLLMLSLSAPPCLLQYSRVQPKTDDQGASWLQTRQKEISQLSLLLESNRNKMDSDHMLVWCHGIVIKSLTIQTNCSYSWAGKNWWCSCIVTEILASQQVLSSATKLILLYNVSRCKTFKCLLSVQQGILLTPIAEERNVVFYFPIPLPSFGKTGKFWSCTRTWYYIHAKWMTEETIDLLDGACHTQKYMIYAFE